MEEDASSSLKTINNWTQNCDMKTSVVLSLYGIMIYVFFTNSYTACFVKKWISITKHIKLSNLNYAYFCIFIIFIIISALSVCMFFGSLIPRIDLKYESIFFFGSIARNRTFETYENKVIGYNEEKVLNDILKQNYAAAKICDKKFKFYKIGLILFGVGLALFLLCAIIQPAII